MTSRNISVCILIFIGIGNSTAAKVTCGPNESIDDCPRNCYEYCPTSELSDKSPCLEQATCPAPACKCDFNYRRAANGTCIPTENCPPFECSGPNEMFDPCPPYCPGDDCSDATPTGECPYFILLIRSCTPSCRCIPQHWRNNGTCVPYDQCPGVQGNTGPEILYPV